MVLFPDENFSTYQWIFTKIGMCIVNVEICFGIVNGQILSIFDEWLNQFYSTKTLPLYPDAAQYISSI